jgi:phage-related minor tail protein
MAEGKKELLITIGAALSGGFNSVISGSTSKLKSVGAAIKDMEKNSLLGASSLDKLKNRYNSLLGSMNRQQAIIQKRGFYRSQIMEMVALGASLAVPIRSAMKFEDSLAKIKAVVNFPEPDGLKKLGETFNKMSQTIPVTADEFAIIASIGGRFGVAAKDLASFSKEVGKTATAWRAPLEETAEKVGNLMKVFGVSTSQLPQYFDAINYLGNKTGATADNILKAVRLQPSDLYYAELFEQEALVVSHSITSEAYFRLPYPLVPRLLRMT